MDRRNFLLITRALVDARRTLANRFSAEGYTDVEKTRAIYEWIVENTFRDPKTRGCGIGDIRDLGGKCADLNAHRAVEWHR